MHGLNEEISELASENGVLRKRISAMRRNSENNGK